MARITFEIIALILSCLLVGTLAKSLAKPKDSKVVLQFEASPAHRTSQPVALPYSESLFWSNDEFLSFDQDNCFTLTRSTAIASTWIDLHFKFHPSDPSSRKLFRMDGSRVHKEFCLDQYIYLNRMNTYELTVSVQGDFSAPFEVTLEQHSGNWTFVQYPGQAKISDGWLFYNDQFDYSFSGFQTEPTLPTFYACDVIANCFKYELKGADGKVWFTLNEKDKKTLLDTTPFIRIYSDSIENGDDSRRWRLDYNNAMYKSLYNIQSLYPDSTLNYTSNTLSLTRKLTPSNNEIHLTLPLDAIDLRIQEATVQVRILSGNDSYLELVGINKSNSALHWPNARIQSDDEFSLSTRQFATLGGADFANNSFDDLVRNLTLAFVAYFDAGFDSLDVDITIKVDHVDFTSRNGGGLVEEFPKHFFTPGKLWDSQNELQWIGWKYVRNLTDSQDWVYKNQLQFNLTDQSVAEGKRINQYNLQMKRIIMGNRGEVFTMVPLDLVFDPNGIQAAANETILNEQLPQSEEYFKLGYLIQKGNYTLNEMWRANINNKVEYFGNENCKRVPSFGALRCHQELFTCPAYFKYNAEKGFCQLIQ